MRILILIFVIAGAAPLSAQAPDSAAFVTRLGADTLVVERFVRTPRRIEAAVVVRVPRTETMRYVLELDEQGRMSRLEGRSGRTGSYLVTRVGDSLRVVTRDGDEQRVRMVPAPAATLPFIDMVHWPYEVALMRVKRSGVAEATVPLLSGSRAPGFGFAVLGPDSMTITHPTRGTMRVHVDAQGRLLALDAGATTRKLLVERKPWLDLTPIRERWAAADAAGRSFGALSGRAEPTVTVHGAAITVDHGTPSKRGRDIWGALVPFGEVWRTGANAATGFATDRDLVFGSGDGALVVPAGRYTLFSIPEQHGGTLIISKETGQAGTAYDPAHDFGRVRLVARPLQEVVEVFTIAATEEVGGRGALRLQWDRTELVAEFEVRGGS